MTSFSKSFNDFWWQDVWFKNPLTLQGILFRFIFMLQWISVITIMHMNIAQGIEAIEKISETPNFNAYYCCRM